MNGDGTIAAGDGFTAQRTSIGVYSITLQSGFRLIGATVFPHAASTAVVNGGGVTPGERSFGVAMFLSSTGASVDGSFSFVAVGVQQ